MKKSLLLISLSLWASIAFCQTHITELEKIDFKQNSIDLMEHKKFPNTKNTLLVRTDFSNDAKWKELCDSILNSYPAQFKAICPFFLNDSSYEKLDLGLLKSLIPEDWNHSFLFIVDEKTMSHTSHPILCVNMFKSGAIFRLTPKAMLDVDSNLSTVNVDFEDFMRDTDAEGIYHGIDLNLPWKE